MPRLSGPERLLDRLGLSRWRPLAHKLGQPKRLWLGAGLVAILTVLLSSNLIPDRVSLQVGEPSPGEIRAHRTVDYVDLQETRRLRDEAAQRVSNVYDEVPFATSDALQGVTDLFRRIEESKRDTRRADGRLGRAGTAASLKSRLPFPLSDASLALLLQLKPDAYFNLRSTAERIVEQSMSQELRDTPSDIPLARDRLNSETRTLPFPPMQRMALAEIAGQAIRPNRFLNVRQTDRRREEERLSVSPVHRQVLRGDVVLHKDDLATTEAIEKLEALGLQQPALDWTRVGYLALILGILVFLFSLYLREYQPEVFGDYRRLALLAALATLSVLAVKVGASVLGVKIGSSTVGYLNMLWIPTAAMLVCVVVGPHVAVVNAALLAVGTGLGLDIELHFVTAAFVSSLAGIYAASHLRDRSSLVRTGLTMAATNASLVIVLSGFNGDPPVTLGLGLGWAIGAGVGASLLFWLGIALLERPFGVTTHVGLLELCDTNRPILKRLLMEAPGTYHHSMVVASLVEAAAGTIGADPLLTRTMAYYHDVGKLRRPQFFIENQRLENVHDRLSPSLSMIVIAAHVRDGVEIARELRLPPPILDGIREHHGTGLVAYFYHRAAGAQGPSAELEHQFRYDGPKPATKETALLMLADGVEAASRVLAKATPGQIDDLIGRILQDRLTDGQLDQCDLTLRDLDQIAQSFSRTLTGMLHSRIEYPKVITTTEARKALKYAALDSKPGVDSGARPAASQESDTTIAAS